MWVVIVGFVAVAVVFSLLFHVLCSHPSYYGISNHIAELVVRIVGKIPDGDAQSESEIEGRRLSVLRGELLNPTDDRLRHGQIFPTETNKNLSCGEG